MEHEYKKRIKQAEEIINQHNKYSGGKGPKGAEWVKYIEETGFTTVELLATLEIDDLTALGLPRLVAKQVLAKLTGRAALPLKSVDVSQLTDAQLIEDYNVDEPDNAHGERLKVRSNRQNVLVVDEDGKLDRERTKNELKRLRKKLPERSDFVFKGKIYRVFSVGNMPQPGVEILLHPLFPEKRLDPADGISDAGFEWGKVRPDARRLLSLAVTGSKELNPTVFQEWQVYELIEDEVDADAANKDANETVARLSELYPKAAIMHLEEKALKKSA